jgi:tetratricopeptide (TPR) repeat protein
MQTAAMTSCFFTGCSSKVGLGDSENVVSHGGLIQHIVVSHLAKSVSSRKIFLNLTDALIHFAEQAYTLRNLEALEEVSRVLISLPLDEARQIGLYYHSLAINRKGRTSEAEALLEGVVNNAPITYRARAIQTLGANNHDRGQLDEALRFQLEALRAASDCNTRGLQTTLLARLEIATIKSLNEDHKGALAILNSLSPLVQIVGRQNPLYFYFYHNELAVEFGELGRTAEAEAACAVALASPFASAYPEWTDTRLELEAKRTSATPSVVAINRARKPLPPRSPNRTGSYIDRCRGY